MKKNSENKFIEIKGENGNEQRKKNQYERGKTKKNKSSTRDLHKRTNPKNNIFETHSCLFLPRDLDAETEKNIETNAL